MWYRFASPTFPIQREIEVRSKEISGSREKIKSVVKKLFTSVHKLSHQYKRSLAACCKLLPKCAKSFPCVSRAALTRPGFTFFDQARVGQPGVTWPSWVRGPSEYRAVPGPLVHHNKRDAAIYIQYASRNPAALLKAFPVCCIWFWWFMFSCSYNYLGSHSFVGFCVFTPLLICFQLWT